MLAEGEGFEPPNPFLSQTAFKAGQFAYTVDLPYLAEDEGIEPPNPESKSDVIPFN